MALWNDVNQMIKAKHKLNDDPVYDPASTNSQLPPPVVRAVNSAQRLFEDKGNNLELFDRMSTFDDAIYTALDMKASLIRATYRGLYLEVGSQRTPEEDGLINLLGWIENEMKLEGKFYTYGKRLMTFGNWILLKNPLSDKPDLKSLPIKHLTIVEDTDQIEKYASDEEPYQVFNKNIYVLNEDNEQFRLVFDKSQIIHMALDDDGTEKTDLMGRFTYGVWGCSPLEALKTITLWKHNTILNDILIRHRIVPRELHGMDLSNINERRIGLNTDDMTTKRTKAMQLAEEVMLKHEARIAYKEADQAYIYDKNATEISMLSPQGFKYAEPNKVIDQQNQAIARVFGIPISVFDSESGGSFASDVIRSSFVMVRTPDISRVIKDGLLEFIKEYISTYFPYFAHLLDKIDIRLQLVMDKDLDRLFKVATVMSQMRDSYERPLFKPKEIREIVGYEPFSDQDYIDMGYNPQPLPMDLPLALPMPNIGTPAEAVGHMVRSNPSILPYPKTDATKDSDQWSPAG